MKNRRNYYRILHIQPDAPPAIIKASYRTQMQKLKMHPDLGGDEWNASVLNEAYRVLSDPEQRAAYDAAFLHGSSGISHSTQSNQDRSEPQDCPSGRHNGRLCLFCRTPQPLDSGTLATPRCSGCGGPLHAARDMQPPDAARRACERIAYHMQATLYLETGAPGLPARLRDLSPVGLQLQSEIPLRNGQIVRIECPVVATIGRVVYCNRAVSGRVFSAGIFFVTVHFHRKTGVFVAENA